MKNADSLNSLYQTILNRLKQLNKNEQHNSNAINNLDTAISCCQAVVQDINEYHDFLNNVQRDIENMEHEYEKLLIESSIQLNDLNCDNEMIYKFLKNSKIKVGKIIQIMKLVYDISLIEAEMMVKSIDESNGIER